MQPVEVGVELVLDGEADGAAAEVPGTKGRRCLVRKGGAREHGDHQAVDQCAVSQDSGSLPGRGSVSFVTGVQLKPASWPLKWPLSRASRPTSYDRRARRVFA